MTPAECWFAAHAGCAVSMSTETKPIALPASAMRGRSVKRWSWCVRRRLVKVNIYLVFRRLEVPSMDDGMYSDGWVDCGRYDCENEPGPPGVVLVLAYAEGWPPHTAHLLGVEPLVIFCLEDTVVSGSRLYVKAMILGGDNVAIHCCPCSCMSRWLRRRLRGRMVEL